MQDEARVRHDAILFVRSLRERWVAVPAAELRRHSIHLKGQQGIFKPAELSAPISLTTTIRDEYVQDVIEGSCVMYDYVSRDFDNEALKRCADEELPLIYFLQVTRRPSPEYVVFAPVYVVDFNDEERRFLVDLSEQKPSEIAARATRQLGLFRASGRQMSRDLVVSGVQQRLIDARYRNEVVARQRQCAICGLKIRALLDATPTGIALCATHNRAFGAGILTIDAEGTIHVRLRGKRAGDGEQSMLLAYDGQKARIRAHEKASDPPSDGDAPSRG